MVIAFLGNKNVAMITTTLLTYHPIYIYFLAIGYGSMVGSWMNDSRFGLWEN